MIQVDKIKVGYSTSIPIMAYGIKDNAWAEVEVSGDGDFKEIWNELKAKVDAAVREKYPHLYTESGKPITIEPVEGGFFQRATDIPDNPDKALIDTLNYCTSVTMLEKFRPQVERRNNPEVTKAFELKLKSLQ